MSSTENGYRRVLRPEACPLAYDRLDTSQKDGFVRITQALQDAVDSLPDKRPKPEQPANQWNPWMPEKDRKSKVVFLSGERGTGKTTLMLTVLQHFLDQDGSKIAPAPELKVRLHDLSRRIIWLAPIDMEPLPQPSNLYAAILARIEHALDHQVKSADEGERERPDSECFPGILDPRGQGPYRDCLKRLRMLQRDVSTAWNGNLRERAGDLDTEDYFHEVVRSERARVNLTRDLDDLLDHLAWCAPWRGRLENPLFVLPIDDIDLNPEHAVDLLHLLRTLASKRLFTLVLGDIAQMERVLQYKIAGTLSKLRGGIRVGDRSLLQEALETAGEGLRKLIPPGQRIRLATMSVVDALNFNPSDKDTIPDKDTTLLNLLKNDLLCLHPVKFIAPGRSPAQAKYGDLKLSLLDLLIDSIITNNPSEAERLRLRSRFLGLRLLTVTPRLLADLYLGLRAIVDSSPKVSSKDQERKAWLERSHLQIVDTVAHRFHETAPTEHVRAAVYEVEPGRWCLDRSNFAWKMTETERRLVLRNDFRLEVPKLNEAQVYVTEPQSQLRPIKLGVDCASSLSLLHDLLALQWTRDEDTFSSVVGDPLFSDAERVWATVQWSDGMRVNWRLPDWLTVGEYSLFVDYWMTAYGRIGGPDPKPEIQHEYFLFAWIAAATNVLAIPLYDKKKTGLVELPNYLGSGIEKSSWDGLLRLLNTVFQHAETNKYHWALSEFLRIVGDWAADLAMILAPEAGTPRDIAVRFFNDDGLLKVWLKNGRCETVRRRRAEQFKRSRFDPRMLGLVSPIAAFDAIRQQAGALDGIESWVNDAQAEWGEEPPSGALPRLESLVNSLSNVKPWSPGIRRAADYAAGLLLAAEYYPEYNAIELDGLSRGLSPTETDLRRYAGWTPDHSSG